MSVEISNGFVNEVILPSQSQMAELARLNQDIRDEQNLWQRSTAAAELAQKYRDFFEDLGWVGRTINFIPKDEHIKKEWLVLFGNNESKTPQGVNLVSDKLLAQLPASAKQKLNEIGDMQNGYIDDYREATRELRENQQNLTESMNCRTLAFLRAKFLNPKELAIFLSEEQFFDLREASRPCLEAFAKMVDTEVRRGRDPLESIRRQLIEQELESPSAEVVSLVREQPLSGNGSSSTRSWIELLTLINPNLTSATLAEALSEIFPQDLKTTIRTLLETELKQSIMDIKRLLLPYRPVEALTYRVDLKVPSRKGGRHTSIEIESPQKQDAPQKVQHRFILDGYVDPNENQLKEFIRKKFPKAEPAVRDDFVTMLSSLADDPFRLGAGVKLRKEPPKRRYRPIGLPLTTEESKRYRVIYIVGEPINSEDKSQGRQIHFIELIHHDDMDAKYGT